MIYFCWTYHHVVMMLSTILSKGLETDVVLVNKSNALDKNLITKLSKCEMIKNVYFINEEDAPWNKPIRNLLKYTLNRFFFLKRYYDNLFEFNIKDYTNVYVFIDFDSIGAYLNVSHINYHLIEDSKRAFEKDIIKRLPPGFIRKIYPSIIERLLQKMVFFIPIWGNSKYCLDIQTDRNENIDYTKDNKDKFFVCREDDLFRTLNKEQGETIFNILFEKFDYEVDKEYILILTEPLYEDRRSASLDEQLSVYQRLVNQYGKESTCMIKPHPRDKCDYSKLKGDIMILPKTMPSEIFYFMPCNLFSSYYTIGSSAIYTFPVERSYILGEAYINE